MKRCFFYSTAILFCCITCFGQSQNRQSNLPADSKAVTDIRRFDFQNFIYRTSGMLLRISKGRGVYKSNGEEPFSYTVERLSVTYGDLTGDNSEEAAVIVYYTGGGTGAFSKGFLFNLKSGRLKLLTTFEGGDRADGGINKVEIRNGILMVERNEPERMNDVVVGLCCPKYLITTKYRWDGKRLIQVGEPQKIEIIESQV